MLHVGCCGWSKGHAATYARFECVEIQQTFYEPPRVATMERWRAEAPEGFRFAIKAFQLVTHEESSSTWRRLKRPRPAAGRCGSLRDTPEVRAAWDETLAAARALRAEVVLLQVPARFGPEVENIERLRRFAREMPRGDFALAFEPRGPAWGEEEADRLCRELDLLRAWDPFVSAPADPKLQPTAYLRLHGGEGFAHRYSDEELERVLDLARRYERAWVMFNDRWMWDDACRFLELDGG